MSGLHLAADRLAWQRSDDATCCGTQDDTTHDQRTRSTDLSRLPGWNPVGDMVAQRRAWEELAVVYNQDLPAIGALEENVELRAGLRADVAVPKRAGPHPVAIYLHGGGWAFGSPVLFRKLGTQFAEAGYLTIILRLSAGPGASIPGYRSSPVDCT